MFLIPCPFCGPRAQVEFGYGGDARRMRPADDAGRDAWFDFVYLRDNPRGTHREHWQHVAGCRAWIAVERDTLTHEILSSAPARGPR